MEKITFDFENQKFNADSIDKFFLDAERYGVVVSQKHIQELHKLKNFIEDERTSDVNKVYAQRKVEIIINSYYPYMHTKLDFDEQGNRFSR